LAKISVILYAAPFMSKKESKKPNPIILPLFGSLKLGFSSNACFEISYCFIGRLYFKPKWQFLKSALLYN
jgi:hypothetical protein